MHVGSRWGPRVEVLAEGRGRRPRIDDVAVGCDPAGPILCVSIGGVHVGSANYLTEWLKQTARNGLMASSICVAQHLTYNARGLLKKAKGRYRRKKNRS
jgi:hypothetical protein